MSRCNTLYEPAFNFLKMYERVFGEPEKECTEYWELHAALRKMGMRIKPIGEPNKRQTMKAEALKKRFDFANLLIEKCNVVTTNQLSDHCLSVNCVNQFDGKTYNVLMSYKNDGSLHHCVITGDVGLITPAMMDRITKVIKTKKLNVCQ